MGSCQSEFFPPTPIIYYYLKKKFSSKLYPLSGYCPFSFLHTSLHFLPIYSSTCYNLFSGLLDLACSDDSILLTTMQFSNTILRQKSSAQCSHPNLFLAQHCSSNTVYIWTYGRQNNVHSPNSQNLYLYQARGKEKLRLLVKRSCDGGTIARCDLIKSLKNQFNQNL